MRIAAAVLVALLTLVTLPAPVRSADVEQLVIFSINVQDFAYPEESIATVSRILDIHEAHAVPVDVYLTTTMTDLYEAKAPWLLDRLRTSPVAAVSYHVRPPAPYYAGFDWMEMGLLPYLEQETIVREYETHGLDLATGETTEAPGGYSKLGGVIGAPPWVAAAQADPSCAPAVRSVFREMGATFLVEHGRVINLGDRLDGLYLRPEHVDLKLFEHAGERPKRLLKDAFATARDASGAREPYVVGVKMHDNDFFAEDSAWVTVYVNGSRRPPFDTSRRSALLDESRRAAMWELYEGTVAHVARKSGKYTAVNAPMLAERLGVAPPGATPRLYVSGTMHIETNPRSWPDPDAFVAFLRRATATGMRWSVAAHRGGRRGAPRAAEVIRETEAMGVEWDVHAHEMADRANCSVEIARLGGHPNTVASGVVASELDALADPVRGDGGATWQAEVVWGIVRRPNHTDGSDDSAYGVWRPRGSAAWEEHDPDGRLIAVGGGTRGIAGAESAAVAVAAGAGLPPVISATVMVAPSTLRVVGGDQGIDAIEAFAARMSGRTVVRWATISETAAAWVAAGEVPSRGAVE